ncbi:uncharacterized protein [Drosophila tropicalis]|uniref:uncharacterized protein n=1 Tax=Drosophila tropicalis TaxID=46794 RepID=UPI0035AB6B6D
MALQCVIKPKMWLGLKQILLYVGLLLCVLLQVCRSKTQLQMFCPSVCHCDLHSQRNRAICSAKRLIGANIEIPKTVELLDLSYNDITNIDNECFQETVHLINLTLAHNAISTLHIDAFVELNRLRSLDLSYNRLEQLDEHILESNSQLIQLNLEGNKLATLSNGPILRSSTLRLLNLRNSQINQIDIQFLSALPQLRQLDLAQNMLITLSSSVFYAPRYLASLNIEENPFNCDRALAKVATGLRQRGVSILMSDCMEAEPMQLPDDVEAVNGGNTKMVRMEHVQESSSTKEPQSVSAFGWRDLDSSEEDNIEDEDVSTYLGDVCEVNREELCFRYRNCLERVSHELLAGGGGTGQNMPPDVIERTHNSFDEDDVKLAFVVGGATGICMVIFIITFALCLKSCCEMRKKKKTRTQEAVDAGDTSTLNSSHQTLPSIHNWTPSRVQRQPRRSNPRSIPSRAVVPRPPYGPQDNFVSRLFGRPARSQYYRAINQNTATLIRRLSRSNLFNSRDREPSSPTTPPTSTARFYTEIVDGAAARPETPPPNYGDVVVIENCDNK